MTSALVLLSLGVIAHAEAPQASLSTPKLAVLDLVAEEGVSASQARLLNELLLSEFAKRGRYQVIGGSDIGALLTLEQQQQLMGCDSDVCFFDIGNALGAPYLAVASVGRLGDSYLINLKILDVAAARVLRRSSEQVPGQQRELASAVRRSVDLVTATARREAIVASTTAEGPASLLVLETRVADNLTDSVDAIALTNLATTILDASGVYKVVSNEDVRAMLSTQQQQQLLGCDQPTCLADVGASLGAQFLFYSQVGDVGGAFVVTASVIDTAQALTIDRQSIVVGDRRQIVEAVQVATDRLLGHDATLGPPPPPESRFDAMTVAWPTLAVGGALALAGGLGTGAALYFQAQAENALEQAQLDSSRQSGDIANIVAVSGYVSGGVLLTTGAAFALLSVLGAADDDASSDVGAEAAP